MSLQPAHAVGDDMIWRCDFYNALQVADYGGVQVLGNAPIDKGITCTGVNSNRITFPPILLSGAECTWILDILTGDNVTGAPGSTDFLDQYGFAFTRNTFITNVSFGTLNFYLAKTGSDTGQGIGMNMVANTHYHLCIAYNGVGVGNAGKLQVYESGVVPPSAFYFGTVGNALITTPDPITVFGYTSTSRCRPGSVLYRARIHNRWFTAEDALDEYQQDTCQEITP